LLKNIKLAANGEKKVDEDAVLIKKVFWT